MINREQTPFNSSLTSQYRLANSEQGGEIARLNWAIFDHPVGNQSFTDDRISHITDSQALHQIRSEALYGKLLTLHDHQELIGIETPELRLPQGLFKELSTATAALALVPSDQIDIDLKAVKESMEDFFEEWNGAFDAEWQEGRARLETALIRFSQMTTADSIASLVEAYRDIHSARQVLTGLSAAQKEMQKELQESLEYFCKCSVKRTQYEPIIGQIERLAKVETLPRDASDTQIFQLLLQKDGAGKKLYHELTSPEFKVDAIFALHEAAQNQTLPKELHGRLQSAKVNAEQFLLRNKGKAVAASESMPPLSKAKRERLAALETRAKESQPLPLWKKKALGYLFLGLQLSAHWIEAARKMPLREEVEKMQESLRSKLSEEDKGRIERETQLIATLLNTPAKFRELRSLSDEAFAKLGYLDRYPNTRALLDLARKDPQCTSPEQIEVYVKAYEMQATAKASTVHLTAGEWMNLFMEPEAAPLVGAPSIVQRVSTAAQNLWKELYKFGSPQEPNGQSFPLTTLERELRESMAELREAAPFEVASHYGNKHRNLVLMDELDKAIDLPGLEIPAPRGIASDDVLRFLQKRAPNVFIHWKALQELYANNRQESPFLQQAEPISHLDEIAKEIEKAFTEPSAINDLNAPLEWLAEREQAGDFLMVRSTGAEDGKMANAGGNRSRAYVSASHKSFMEATGDVIASYFGKSSLENRLNGGANPFEEDLQLAVLAQVLVGEPVGGAQDPSQIPVSFVLFTNEPLYIGEEKFRAMRLSASYGHGEGVVSNQGIGTDSALLLHSEAHPDQLYILYDNQKKPERLVPIQRERGVVLEKLANPDALTKKRALTYEALAEIYRSGVVMESFFGDTPTDIEGVKIGNKIYFVQARPVNRKPLLPTYLKGKQGVVEKLQLDALVIGKASVVVLSNKEEVLVAATLEQAERLFSRQKAGTYKLVIVSQEEPQNSHPVVNFSSLGIPCLYTSDRGAVENLLRKINADHQIAVCMQTATLNLWDRRQGSLEEQIQEGFAVHPAKVAISLPVESRAPKAPASGLQGELKDLLIQLRDAPSTESKLALLKQIEQKTQTLKIEIDRLEKIVSKEQLVLLKQLDASIDRALEEMSAVIQGPAERLQELLHLKALETVLIGANRSGIGHYSLRHVEEIVRLLNLAIEHERQLGFPAQCTEWLLMGAKAANPVAFPHWQKFVLDVESLLREEKVTPEEFQEFETILSSLEKSQTLPRWLAFLPQDTDSLTSMKRILVEQTSADRALMAEFLQTQSKVEQMTEQQSRFADPKTHADAWKELTALTDFYSSPKWLQMLATRSPATRSMAYGVMEQVLTLLDLSLKTLKMSDRYEGAAKGALFKQMLTPYFLLMKRWGEAVPLERISAHELWPRERYFYRIEEILNRLDSTQPTALLPSQVFSVAAAVLNAGTVFDRHEPATLEDMLTLLHQNSLEWISAFNQALVSPQDLERAMLPEAVKKGMMAIEENRFDMRVQRTGFQVHEDAITIDYNVPLRNHSGHLTLRYDLRSSKLSLEGKFFGEARARWAEIENWAHLFEEATIYPPTHPSFLGELEFKFFWNVSAENLGAALEEYAIMAAYTMERGEDYDQVIRSLVERWKNRPQYRDLSKIALEKEIQSAYVPFYEQALERVGDNPVYSAQGREKILFAIATSPERLAMWNELMGVTDDPIWQSIQTFAAQFPSEEERRHFTIDRALEWVGSSEHFRLGLNVLKSTSLDETAIDAIVQLMRELSKSNRSLALQKLFEMLADKKEGYAAVVLFANEQLNSPIMRANGFFRALVERGIALEMATEAAKQTVNDQDPMVRNVGLALYAQLINRGVACEEAAIDAAKQAVGDQDAYVCQEGLSLFIALVDKGLTYEPAIAAAKGAVNHPDSSVRRGGLALFRNLVAKGMAYEEALITAKQAVESRDVECKAWGISLFRYLVEKDVALAYEPAAHIAKEAWNNNLGLRIERETVRREGLYLYMVLSGKGIANEEAIEAAKQAVNDQDFIVRRGGLALYARLINRGVACEEAAIDAAKQAVGDRSAYVCQEGLSLFIALVDKGLAYEPAIAAAKGAVNHPEFSVRRGGLALFRNLVAKGMAYEEALIAAKQAVESRDVECKAWGISLFRYLVEKDVALAYEPAAHIAKEAWNNNLGLPIERETVRREGLYLYMILSGKGIANEEAIEALQQLNERDRYFLSLIKNRSVALALVKQNGEMLQYLSLELRNDREIALEAVRHLGFFMSYVSSELRNDREFVLTAARLHSTAISYASQELRQNDWTIWFHSVTDCRFL